MIGGKTRMAAALLGFGACAQPIEEPRAAATGTVDVMTYNVAQLMGEPSGENVTAHIAATGADFVAVQEANDGGWLLDHLPATYELTNAPDSNVALLYDATRWALRDTGSIALGANDDGWGRRVAVWGLFADQDDGGLYVYSTHWCVTIRRPDDLCDQARQMEYADEILGRLDDRLPSVVAGDLNVFDGFETGAVIRRVLDAGLVDVFRALHPDLDGDTFIGNSWAPPGRIDYLFTTAPVTVHAAAIEDGAVPAGQGSDHHAVVATVSFP